MSEQHFSPEEPGGADKHTCREHGGEIKGRGSARHLGANQKSPRSQRDDESEGRPDKKMVTPDETGATNLPVSQG